MKAVKVMKLPDHFSYEEMLRELGFLSLKKRKLGRILFMCIMEQCKDRSQAILSDVKRKERKKWVQAELQGIPRKHSSTHCCGEGGCT